MRLNKCFRKRKHIYICMMVVFGIFVFNNLYHGTFAKENNGFITENSNTYYYQNGEKKKGFIQIKGSKYYFDEKTGIMKKGYTTINGKKYLFDEKTGKMLTGIRVVNKGTQYETKYKFMPEGDVFKKGLYKEPTSGSYYYFNKTTGAAHKGNLVDEYGRRFIFDNKTGVMLTGLRKLNNYTYYYKETGDVYKGGIKTINGSKYYFDKKTGIMKKGYLNVEGVKYYLDKDTGVLQNGLHTVNAGTESQATYYFLKNGDVFRGGIINVDGKRYYFDDKTGAVRKGYIKTVNKKHYYANPETGVLINGMKRINDNTVYYFTASGTLKTGLLNIGNDTFYFNPSTGNMQTGMQILNVSGVDKKYWFDRTSGKAFTGVQYVENLERNYYFDPKVSSGLRTGLQKYNSETYYFDEYGVGHNQLQSIDRNLYYFDKNTYVMKKNYDISIEQLVGNNTSVSGITFSAGNDGKVTINKDEELNTRSKIIYNGLLKLGQPYAYTDDQEGFNCSSFVYYSYQEAGLETFGNGTGNSNSWKTYTMAPYVYDHYQVFSEQEKLKPGDLIFWSKENCGNSLVDENGKCLHRFIRDKKEYHVHHVGIYLGNGQVLESYEPKDAVIIQDLKITSPEENENYYFSYFADAIHS